MFTNLFRCSDVFSSGLFVSKYCIFSSGLFLFLSRLKCSQISLSVLILSHFFFSQIILSLNHLDWFRISSNVHKSLQMFRCLLFWSLCLQILYLLIWPVLVLSHLKCSQMFFNTCQVLLKLFFSQQSSSALRPIFILIFPDLVWSLLFSYHLIWSFLI